MFFVQPATVVGRLICDELQSREKGQREWQRFEFAAAWVNKLGAEALSASAQDFLADRGAIVATVGLDFGSTSYEGLEALLNLEVKGARMKTFVFYDENPMSTFHPKVYLFSNSERARLFVGSCNLTGAGLSTNVE